MPVTSPLQAFPIWLKNGSPDFTLSSGCSVFWTAYFLGNFKIPGYPNLLYSIYLIRGSVETPIAVKLGSVETPMLSTMGSVETPIESYPHPSSVDK